MDEGGLQLQIEHICGSTYCIITNSMCIPFYKLCSGKIVLMDSGLESEGDELIRLLERNGLFVRTILTSHAHYDHMGNHERFRRMHNAEVYESLFDAAITQSPLTLRACFCTERTESVAASVPYMVCKADRIISPGESVLAIDGAPFQVLDLPGHAHSHLGFVTPDGVAYLGDLLLGEPQLEHNALLFGVSWTQELESAKRAGTFSYPYYVLAHGGVYSDICSLVRKNRSVFLAQAGSVMDLAAEWSSRDQLIAALTEHFHMHTRNELWAHVVERMIMAILEYLEDIGALKSEVREGLLFYQRTEQAFLTA